MIWTYKTAVTRPRFHHQWLPDVVIFEPNLFSQSLMDSLQGKGYDIKEQYSRIIGRVDAILISEDMSLSTGADPRGDDACSSSVLINER